MIAGTTAAHFRLMRLPWTTAERTIASGAVRSFSGRVMAKSLLGVVRFAAAERGFSQTYGNALTCRA